MSLDSVRLVQDLRVRSLSIPPKKTADEVAATLREVPGDLWFDPVTKYLYTASGESSIGFTFEDARWSGGVLASGFEWMRTTWLGSKIFGGPLNPLDFATAYTAEIIASWVEATFPEVQVRRDYTQDIAGPYMRTINRRLLISPRMGVQPQEQHSCGRLAEVMVRYGFENGVLTAARSLEAELVKARIISQASTSFILFR